MMKITERQLLDGFDGISNGGGKISIIGGKKIFWDYRTGLDSDGYNPVCRRERANEISLENDRSGTIDVDDNCDEHPAIQRIIDEEAALWGDRV